MCLAVPMEIIKILDFETGQVDINGVQTPVNLSLVDNPVPGDFVIVHAGFAIEKLDIVEAEVRLSLVQEWADSIKDESGGQP